MTSPCPCRGCTSAYKAGQEDQRRALHDTWRTNLRLIEHRHARDTYTAARDLLDHYGADVAALRRALDERIAHHTIDVPPRPANLDAVNVILDALEGSRKPRFRQP